jgi:hypothetical protein
MARSIDETEQLAVELGERTRIGAVEHDLKQPREPSPLTHRRETTVRL